MQRADIDGIEIAYDVIGEGRPWTITPGGRYSKDDPGIRELGEALAAGGYSAIIWDRPNCGDSDVSFRGPNESAVQADALAGLLRHLECGPAIIAGGSGGSRVSLLTAARHPELARGIAVWWISGGIYGLMSLGMYYCGGSLDAAWHGGMEAVAALPEWQEVQQRNPRNRDIILSQDRTEFIKMMEQWMEVYFPNPNEPVPGLTNERVNEVLTMPALVFRSGESDLAHTRATSENLYSVLPNAEMVEPPWGDTEWNDRHTLEAREEGLFFHWPMLAPQLLEWADRHGI
jgi:pimeloyl-ACP methyl ester carboxylesterase